MRRPALLLGIALLASPATGTAQTSDPGPGTWVGAGIGGGWTRVSCAICRRDRALGPAGFVRFGTTLRPGFLLGAEVQGWTHENEDDIRSIVGAASATAYLYPDPARGLYFKGGLGFVRYSAKESGDDQGVGTNLLGIVIGAGYQFEVAPGLSVTNYVSLLASSFGSLRRDNASVTDDVSVSLLQIGIGITKH